MAEHSEESARSVARRLELTRLALGAKDRQTFARSIGISPQGWSNVTGAAPKRIGIDTALTMCKRYGVTLEWIYRGNTYGMPGDLVGKIEELSKIDSKPARATKKT